MATIPVPMNTTVDAIERLWASRNEPARDYLGASEIGRPCSRALWFSFRWATARAFDGRMMRLFHRGHREEPAIIEELRALGVEVHDRDPDTGQQFEFSAVRGHFAGHCDGIAFGLPEAPKTWAVLEFKTHSAKSFAALQADGVARAKPEHYAQMQIYMGLAELTRALYLAVNKDNDALHGEWLHFDQSAFDALIAKAESIVAAEEPPPRLSDDPAWWQCKLCDHHALCHGDAVPQKTCRSCVHATPVDNRQWHCADQSRILPVAEQRIGCRQHLFIPPMIRWAEPLDAGNGWIKYRDRDTDAIFANVTEDCDRSEENMTQDITHCLTSAEWPVTVRSIVNDALVGGIKQALPGSRIVDSIVEDDVPF